MKTKNMTFLDKLSWVLLALLCLGEVFISLAIISGAKTRHDLWQGLAVQTFVTVIVLFVLGLICAWDEGEKEKAKKEKAQKAQNWIGDV